MSYDGCSALKTGHVNDSVYVGNAGKDAALYGLAVTRIAHVLEVPEKPSPVPNFPAAVFFSSSRETTSCGGAGSTTHGSRRKSRLS